MKVADIIHTGQGIELLPIQGHRMIYLTIQRQCPAVQGNIRLDPEIKYGKTGREPLPGRKSVVAGFFHATLSPSSALFQGPFFLGLDVALITHGEKLTMKREIDPANEKKFRKM
jgi:hypothetical protein